MVLLEMVDGQYIVAGKRNRWGRLVLPDVGGIAPEASFEETGDGWCFVRVTWSLPEPVAQDDVAVALCLDVDPDFWWAPHLAPEEGWCVAQHVFRSPALIAGRGADYLALVPALESCGANPDTPWYLDYDAPGRKMTIGLSRAKVTGHIGFRKEPGMQIPAGRLELSFRLACYGDEREVRNPWGPVARFLWNRYGHPLFESDAGDAPALEAYVRHTYHWAFESWKDAMWQEFTVDGHACGAPAFIVNVTQSPNYPGEVNMREDLSVWNQAWFSTLRAMTGVARYAKETGNADLLRRANLAKEWTLAAPSRDGFFPSVYRTEMETVQIDGRELNRSKGWATGYWTNSNRVPRNLGLDDRWYHILDTSWTCLLMLRWHEEIEADARLVERARRYADKLLTLQDSDGFFPAWLHPETLKPAPVLAQSPETSMSVTFLLKLAEVTGNAEYRTAALRAMDAVVHGPAAEGRWEDFETFWSCCPFGAEHLGRKHERNAMYKQCNFSMFWTAEALLAAWRATGENRYLEWGRRTLDELSMTQQVWQPPFIHVSALGGFGVMNFDGEWNDSRQNLFAELFMDYYRVTGEAALFERGVAALRAGFVMMYCPENPSVRKLWEKVWSFFGPADYGFMMENYGHGGVTSAEGAGMGDFTIFTWGNGAAAEARNRIRDHYGDVYVDRRRRLAFAIDSINVRLADSAVTLVDRAHATRIVKIAFEDGSRTEALLDGTVTVALG